MQRVQRLQQDLSYGVVIEVERYEAHAQHILCGGIGTGGPRQSRRDVLQVRTQREVQLANGTLQSSVVEALVSEVKRRG